ncbi:MAG: chemotaxis-specific protein-glutamate methyltransferase CheB [Anaerolineae bacterium]|jgi:two-component system chemotaxis response regulator CheB|nr:chemotaxis-specific protein-glutamate methyltransferase CheB [Anaerolineae bacterium]
MTRVLIVDDSATGRALLTHILQQDARLHIVGQAVNGRQAVAMTLALRPQVILMDIVMPELDGLEATRQIMEVAPTPIVMITGAAGGREAELAFRALRDGALMLLEKPVAPDHADFKAQAARILKTVRSMAEVKVIRHRTRPLPPGTPSAGPAPGPAVEMVGVVASTGGPAALVDILSRLPAAFPLPLVIVQHISGDFLPSLRDWLQQNTPLTVAIAAAGAAPRPGTAYLARQGAHLRLTQSRRFEYVDTPLRPHMPAGDVLLESLAQVYGPGAAGIVLTGMGEDGAAGLAHMARAGAVTIAQNEASSVIFGMPGEAVRRGAAQHILSLREIAALLNRMTARGDEAHE